MWIYIYICNCMHFLECGGVLRLVKHWYHLVPSFGMFPYNELFRGCYRMTKGF